MGVQTNPHDKKIPYNSMRTGSVASGAGTVGSGVVQYGSGVVRCGPVRLIVTPLIVVATFTHRSSHISKARFMHSLLLAVSLAAGRRSAPRDRAMAGLLLFVDSLLNRCYFLVSGSVRLRRGIVGRLG